MPRHALIHRDPSGSYPVIARGEGIYLIDEQGNRYIDGVAGAGNVTLGHGQKRIAEVMADQAEKMAYCFSAFFTNRPALDLASRLAALAPGDLNHVYFVSGGSEGNETAFKLARLYHIQRGNGSKHKIISRWRSYHGATLGALAASGLPALRAPFAPWIPDFPKIEPSYPYRCKFAGCAGTCNLMCADQLEEAILQAGPETVAAFIGEPVVNGGITVSAPHDDYYPRIREICDRYDVLFIADEIITGFGRTGRTFAIEHWDVVPDLVVFGKGVTAGYIPLGGVLVSDTIRDTIDAYGAFPHVFTYVDNPVATRVASTVLDILDEENILEHVVEMGAYLESAANRLYEHPIVGDIRVKGLMMGVELVRDRETRAPFSADQKVSARIPQITMEHGLHVSSTTGCADWVNGDDVRFYPPLIITAEEIETVISVLDLALGQASKEFGAA